MSSSQRTILQSLRTLVDPKTIPFLISQGVPRKLFPLGTFLLGIILAFLWAYVISPNVYTAAEAVHLGDSWKREYVKQTAWQYSAARQDPNTSAVALQNAQLQLDYLGNAPEIVNGLIVELQTGNPADPLLPRLLDIQPLARENPDQIAKVTSSFFNGNLTPVLCVVVPALLIGGIIIFNTIIPIGVLFQRKSSAPSTVQEGLEKERRKAMEDARKKAVEAEKIVKATPESGATVTVDRGTPVAQFMSTYIMGDDYFDDSFAIETSAGKFLGETGAGVSKVIGVGDPKKVTALEVWVFDANTTNTLTKVLMTEHAYRDEATRAELAPKGEAVMIKTGDAVLLETATLTIQARILDLAYATTAMPQDSVFERLSIQISAWAKKADAPDVASAFGDTSPMDLPR
ncbi:MAG TPA: hypothetical protein PLD47_08095 [Aggregatilineales bacterium]|nr:hypothetical protein [Anaerolineales bacterium]HRE47670.1 hypothetical protein [Aggregatilineales bacterium]